MENVNTQTWSEKFNLWVYNFLIAVLPYVTPFPVAWMTADSAASFLSLHPYVSAVLVFALEGIGLLCTSLAVDAIVEWIRSRSWKTFVPVVMFGAVIYAYLRILIILNVTLEASTGNTNPALSQVITLLCYLPMISGVVNGWNKLRIEGKQKQAEQQAHNESREDMLRREQMEREDRERQERLEFEREKLQIMEAQKTERVKAKLNAPVAVVQPPPQPVPQQTELSASAYKDDIRNLLTDVNNRFGEEGIKKTGVKQIAQHFKLDYERNKGYISTLRKKWMVENNLATK